MKLAVLTGLVLLAVGCPTKTPSSSGASPASVRAGFPPVDLRCVKDDDCDTHHRYLTADDRCCYTCNHRIGAKTWVAAVMKICATKSHRGCPMKKCVAPPELKCVAGKCAARK